MVRNSGYWRSVSLNFLDLKCTKTTKTDKIPLIK